MTHWLPPNTPRVSCYLIVENLSVLKDFVTSVFGAEIPFEMTGKNESIDHLEIRIGDSLIMSGKSSPEFPPLVTMIHLYVPDCDSVYQTALNNGAETVMPPSNQFYGDRSAGLKGPDGNFWWIATRIEDLSQEELVKRHHEQKERGKDV